MRTKFEHAAIPVERHIGSLTDRKGAPDTDRLVRSGDAACAGHPAVLAYAIGNETPAATARTFFSNRGRLIHRDDPVADALAGRAPEP
ncbi:MAG TPA: hypothetical protein VIV10_03990 [Gemmatimonadales bacterium]